MSDHRILIVSDDQLARAGLAALVANQPGLAIAAQVSNDAELAQALDVFAPDVILWDCGSSVDAARERIAELDATPPVLVLIPAPSDARSLWGDNVRGILPRDAAAAKITAGLESVALGLTVLDSSLQSLLAPARSTDSAELIEPLTPREQEVLELVARGLANKAIAQALSISDHTVKFHINSILAKLGAASRTEAVVRATRLGLITL